MDPVVQWHPSSFFFGSKRVPLFSRVTEQLRGGLLSRSIDGPQKDLFVRGVSFWLSLFLGSMLCGR